MRVAHVPATFNAESAIKSLVPCPLLRVWHLDVSQAAPSGGSKEQAVLMPLCSDMETADTRYPHTGCRLLAFSPCILDHALAFPSRHKRTQYWPPGVARRVLSREIRVLTTHRAGPNDTAIRIDPLASQTVSPPFVACEVHAHSRFPFLLPWAHLPIAVQRLHRADFRCEPHDGRPCLQTPPLLRAAPM